MVTNIKKQQIFSNMVMSVGQVIVTGGVLFILYHFLLNSIGIKQLGIWALVLSTTSAAGIASFGISGSVVKYVAKYVARGEYESVVALIQTALLSIGVVSGCVLLIAFPLFHSILAIILSSVSLKQALLLLPYSLLSLWINIISGVLQSGLDGYQRIDIRTMITTLSTVLHFLLSIVFVPLYGLLGLAYAQLFQAGVLLVANWVFLKKVIPALPVFPYQWNRKLFREMIVYGINFQTISLTQMLCDPITKALLSKFAGLSATGFYEMASRMLLQFRLLLVSANQVLVPTVAHLHEINPNLIKNIYMESYNLMFYIALPFYSIIIASTPLISEVWIGHYENDFVIFSGLLSIGLFINTLSVPAYFSYLGIGVLKWNTSGHIVTAVMNAAFGVMFGYNFGGMGVVIAWIISLVTGGVIIVISYHYTFNISLKQLLPRESRGITVACIFAILCAFLIIHKINNFGNHFLVSGLALLIFLMIIVFPFWLHPMRRRLMGWVKIILISMKTNT